MAIVETDLAPVTEAPAAPVEKTGQQLEECMVCLQDKTPTRFVQPECTHNICKRCYARCEKCPYCRAIYVKPPKKMSAKEFGILLFHRDRAQLFVNGAAARHQAAIESLRVLQEQVTQQEVWFVPNRNV